MDWQRDYAQGKSVAQSTQATAPVRGRQNKTLLFNNMIHRIGLFVEIEETQMCENV